MAPLAMATAAAFTVVTASPAPATAATPAWSIQKSPNPPRSSQNNLDAVSCRSATACQGVGSYVSGTNHQLALAESWKGNAWKIRKTPRVKHASLVVLSGVSCTSARACTAVGDYTNASSVERTLAERWNGKVWTIQKTPGGKSGLSDGSLSGVSCTSARDCIAVGRYRNSSGTGGILAEQWNGKAWKIIQKSPRPKGKYATLAGVSCSSAEACVAVGSYISGFVKGHVITESWNGRAWTIHKTPNPKGSPESSLSGVSCSSAKACTAVGTYSNASGHGTTLAERWNGTTWTIQKTPNPGYDPTESYNGFLFGVSCTAARSCTAVGYYNKGPLSNDSNIAEKWNGKVWKAQKAPNPSDVSGLSGVSCTLPTACTAVGSYTNASARELTLVERYS